MPLLARCPAHGPQTAATVQRGPWRIGLRLMGHNGSKRAQNGLNAFEHPKRLKIDFFFLRKHIFDPFFTHFWPRNAGVGVGCSRISQLAAEAKKNEKNGEKWGKWGKMGENGEKWRKMGENGGKWGNERKCQKYQVGNVEKMCEIRRKLEKNRRKPRGFGTNFPFPPVPLPPFFHSLATFPSGAFDELC